MYYPDFAVLMNLQFINPTDILINFKVNIPAGFALTDPAPKIVYQGADPERPLFNFYSIEVEYDDSPGAPAVLHDFNFTFHNAYGPGIDGIHAKGKNKRKKMTPEELQRELDLIIIVPHR